MQTFSLSCTPTRNEFTGSFKYIISSQTCIYPICRGLSCRLTAEDVDEVDCHCRSRLTWPVLGRLLHRRTRYRNIFQQLQFVALELIPLMTSLKLHHVSLEYNDAARNTFSPADNIAVYFYILCVMVVVLANLFLSIYL